MERHITASILIVMTDQRLRCAFCDDIIGVYEPIVVRDGPGLRHTSLLNEPALTPEHGPMHRDCALDAEPTDANN
jgi:hypothetical protein